MVTRESEWTRQAQSRAIALGVWDDRKCPGCGNYESLVPLPDDLRHYVWDEYDGQRFEVSQYRCLACASAAVIQRDWFEKNKSAKPREGYASPGDGRMFAATPITEESP